MLEIIQSAIQKGAIIFPNVSGGKDGQALVKTLHTNQIPMAALIHADLGSIEWKESMSMCEKLAQEFSLDLFVVKRKDGRGLVEHWRNRMAKLKGKNKPFWSSSKSRYCTSDLKRDVINKFYRSLKHNDFIISAEGIRAGESKERAKKNPLQINYRISSTFYKGMTVQEAIEKFTPGKRLVLTWYAIFNFSTEEVWATYGMSEEKLMEARIIYKATKQVPSWWPFHPAYAYGNVRVSCVFCIMGCGSDLKVGAEHRPELLAELIQMEEESGHTFKNGFSLKSLVA
jgi:3'-phosphoadenosine 5'-phosphosulfate sulfotransferase (PAPS reductase)/FAD synthetase